MERVFAGPARKAETRVVGIGKRPCCASRLAAIRPSVAAGTSASESRVPITGTSDSTETVAMNMKNRPAIARGWRKKVCAPSLTHWKPVRAGTIWSFMQGQGSGGLQRVVAHQGCQGGVSRTRCAQHALEMAGVVGLQQRCFARQVQVPQARDPEAQGAGAQQGGQQAALRRA